VARRRTSKKKKMRDRAEGFLPAKVFSARPILVLFLCAALIGGAFYGIRHFFLNSSFFAIREIVVNKDLGYSFREGERKLERLYLGRNIFTVDLKQVQVLIKNDFPQFKKVEVRRNLPEALEVDIVSRGPAALIDTGGGIIIDAEGVVLNVGEKSEGLIKIKGISFFLNRP
jgi:cell division septal protein FtsQ